MADSFRPVVQALRPQLGASQVVNFDASVQSTAMPQNTKYVKLAATETCFIEFGASPTAVANSTMFLAGDSGDRFFTINGGEKIAVIKLLTAGELYITPMTM